MKLLPLSLKSLADVASKDVSATGHRFTQTGISLTCRDDSFCAVATDGRRLLAVEGAYVGTEADYPSLPALERAPNGELTSIVPASTFKAACQKAEKLTGRRCVPVLRSLACVQGKNETTFGATNLEATMVESTRNVEGRFPRWQQVIPTKPEYRVSVDALLFAETLRAFHALKNDPESTRVDLYFQGGSPIVMRGGGPGMATVTGAMVPLAWKEYENGPSLNGYCGVNHGQFKERVIDAIRKLQKQRETRDDAETIENLENELRESAKLIEDYEDRLDSIRAWTQQWRDKDCVAGSIHRLAE